MILGKLIKILKKVFILIQIYLKKNSKIILPRFLRIYTGNLYSDALKITLVNRVEEDY